MKVQCDQLYRPHFSVNFTEIWDYHKLLNYDIYVNGDLADFDHIEEQEFFFNYVAKRVAEKYDLKFNPFSYAAERNTYVDKYLEDFEGVYVYVEGQAYNRADFMFYLQEDSYQYYALEFVLQRTNEFLRKLINCGSASINAVMFSLVEREKEHPNFR